MRYTLILFLVLAAPPALALELDGRTEFSQRLNLNSSVSARVESVLVTAGQAVSRGELLLRLETAELQAQVDMARAEADALAPIVARMATELDKARELFDRDSLALVPLQNAEQDHAIAAANLQAAEARLARAEYRLSQAELRSPFDGTVLEVMATPGQFINTRVGDPVLLTLADTATMSATALVPLESWHADLLQRGARVSYRGKTYTGKVTGLGRQIRTGDNNHPAIAVEIRFAAGGQVPAGLEVRITIADD